MHYTAQLSLLQTPQVDVKFDEKPLAISSLSHKAGSELLLKQKTFHLKFKSFQCYYMSQELLFPLLSGKRTPQFSLLLSQKARGSQLGSQGTLNKSRFTVVVKPKGLQSRAALTAP